MANPKGNPQYLLAGRGRTKGVPNKFTSLKTAFLTAFEQIGGVTALQEWAIKDKNRAEFYKMIAKMLPNRVEGEIEHSGSVQIVEIPAKMAIGADNSDDS